MSVFKRRLHKVEIPDVGVVYVKALTLKESNALQELDEESVGYSLLIGSIVDENGKPVFDDRAAVDDLPRDTFFTLVKSATKINSPDLAELKNA